jgi:hypothetical protein
MAARLTIATVDHLDDLNQAQPISIDLLQNGRSRLRFTCLPSYQPARFAEVVAYAQDGVTPIYGGFILQRSMAGLAPHSDQPEMVCECVGFESYLDWAYIDLAYTTDPTLQEVLDDLIAALPAGYGITLDATDYSGITLAAFTWTTMRASDGLRELCDRTGRIYRVSPTKELAMPLPGGVAAPANFADGSPGPNCEDLIWQDAATPATTTVKLICGEGQLVYPQTWVSTGTAGPWVADIPAAGAGGYWVVTLDPPGNFYGTVDDGVSTGGMFSWNWQTRTLTSNIGVITAGVTLRFPYTAQYPFTVTATLGGSPAPSPDIQATYVRTDVFSLPQAQEIADGLLATLGGSPRTIEAVTRVEGWEPGQALTVDLDGRAVDATFAVTDVTILWQTAGVWLYTVRAVELSVFPGNYLDQWRALLAGSSSGAGASGSSTGTSVIGGSLPTYYLGGSRTGAVQVPA